MRHASSRPARSPGPIRTGVYSIRHFARFQIATLAVVALAGSPAAGVADPPAEVLIVVNDASAISRAIGVYYQERRGIPADHVVHLSIPVADPTLSTHAHETISRSDFERWIRAPITSHLIERSLHDRIEIMVTTKGIPLRIAEEAGATNVPFSLRSRASVDAELAVLFTNLAGSRGVVDSVNAYFRCDEPFRSWRARQPDPAPRYLVARLTGYQLALDPKTGVPRDVKALIDAATSGGPAGSYVIDEDPDQKDSRAVANRLMLASAADALRALGLPVVHDRTNRFLGDLEAIAGYASWGSNDVNNPGAPFYGSIGRIRYPGVFAPRAITVDLVSHNARSFTDPTPYGQSLLADLLRVGASGGAGHVDEPTLAAVARPHILFPAYARGAPAVEAYFRSLPYLGWTNVYVGDPLLTVAAPVRRTPKDRDGDGARDTYDNCLLLPNPDQRDTDADGYGNLCDADFDGDGRVSAAQADGRGDLERLRRSARQGFYIPNHDLDGDGKVDQTDVAIAELSLYLPPGPSGIASHDR